MVAASNYEQGKKNPQRLRYLRQAARELLLAQSSDWSFILRAGTTTELAKERIQRHLNRFWRLIEVLKPNHLSNAAEKSWLDALEQEDSLFPLVDPSDWQTP
jgi:1,4-alpha-glucan branching enzyme